MPEFVKIKEEGYYLLSMAALTRVVMMACNEYSLTAAPAARDHMSCVCPSRMLLHMMRDALLQRRSSVELMDQDGLNVILTCQKAVVSDVDRRNEEVTNLSSIKENRTSGELGDTSYDFEMVLGCNDMRSREKPACLVARVPLAASRIAFISSSLAFLGATALATCREPRESNDRRGVTIVRILLILEWHVRGGCGYILASDGWPLRLCSRNRFAGRKDPAWGLRRIREAGYELSAWHVIELGISADKVHGQYFDANADNLHGYEVEQASKSGSASPGTLLLQAPF